MKIFNHSMNLWLALLMSFASFSMLLANENSFFFSTIDTSFACNDLVQISLDENCEIEINPDMILEGYDGDYSDFYIDVLDEVGFSVPLPITGEYIGDTLFLIANHIPSGQSCWGRATIEDNLAPNITCSDHTFDCFKSPSGFPLPVTSDNCDGSPSLLLISENIDDSDLCDVVTISRTYIAVDYSGNESEPCTQHITTSPPALPSFPIDTIWSCEVYNAHANVVDAEKLTGNLFSTGSGVPDVALGNYCPYNVVHNDLVFGNDCGVTFSILRTWTVINWCTDEIITVGKDGEDNTQLIKIIDTIPPKIVRPSFSVNANIGSALNEDCGSTDFLGPAGVIDNCHDVTVRILTGIGEAIYIGADGSLGGYIPEPGLPIGEHTIVYEATDECGNIDSLHVKVTVADMTAPNPICDELTNVSLGILGVALVPADVFDDGSFDNCCLAGFQVRRMTAICNPLDSIFGDSITLCCTDVGDTVQVVFRALDCSGNANDCMVLVEVEEKLPPVLESCPANEIIDCDFYVNHLELALSTGQDSVLDQFGLPVFKDNCGLVYLENAVNIDLDQCQQGFITRLWRVTDPGANATLTCAQSIKVEHHSNWVVEFPADQFIECGDTFPETGEPTIFFETCELIAVSYEDEVFTLVADACYKIARTWTVINWCAIEDVIENILIEDSEKDLNFDLNYDGSINDRTYQDGVNVANFSLQANQYGAQQDGVVAYQQIIKINDDKPPIVNCLPMLEICISDTSCTTEVELPIPDAFDCSTVLDFSATGDLGTGLGPFTAIPSGIYHMTYQVKDNCGNTGFCETNIEIRDCKKPTPLCKDGLIIELDEDSIIIVNPEIFDEGSYDNCPGDLSLSFSSNPSDTTLILDCGILGYRTIEIWVTDAAGNQDFCLTNVFVQDNMGVCTGDPLISGFVETALHEPVHGVSVSLNVDQKTTLTEGDGYFVFEAENDEDVSLSCAKGENPLNGVTTFDIVLISKHILGVLPLDEPYKIIAADVNQSNSVTTYDLVALRKIILQVSSNFPNDKAWRFVDGNFTFLSPENPFDAPFPEVLNFNDLNVDVLDADFIAIKLGDVNYSADPQQ